MSGTGSQTPPDGGPSIDAPAPAAGPSPTRTAKPARARRFHRGGVAVIAAAALAVATGAVGLAGQYRWITAPPAASATAPTAPAPGVTGAAVGTVIMVIRHGEKPDEDVSALPGVSADGAEDERSLTAVGWDRAKAIAEIFDPARGAVRPGLVKPTAIFAAGANEDGEGKRTRETVGPLAHRLGIAVDTDYGKGDEESLVAAATSRPGPTLICWQHGEIPTIAQALGSVTPAPPQEWPDDRFDVVWVFTRTPSGWNFTQAPEMALRTDSDTTITDDESGSGRS